MAYRFLLTCRDGHVEYVTLNRPDVRNAFNEVAVDELTRWAEATSRDGGVRAAVLGGAGKVFCAGADLAWMSKTVDYTRAENVRDAEATARMYAALDELPMPLVGRVHGAALGGGAGLAAVCDVVVAGDDTVFGFTEVRLGILPSIIAPFVLAKIGASASRELFLTGARFGAARAREIGLIHAVTPSAEIDARVADYVREILSGGPEAIATSKALLRRIAGQPAEAVRGLTAETIAERRASAEGQEGMKAFLQKRTPTWSSSQ